MAALAQRAKTGKGQLVQSALFENNIFLVAQHMMQFAVTGKPAAPMPSRISPWGVYDVFKTLDGEMIFLAVVSDTQWALFCDAFGLAELKADPRLASNNLRVQARDWMMPVLRARLAELPMAEIVATFEAKGLPFAPISKPHDLLDDPHLLQTGGLAPVTLPADASVAGKPIATRAALLPLTLDGQRLPLRSAPPSLGEHTRSLLSEIGYSADEVAALLAAGVIGG
jgi:crotonobetainyl-CoA:carnitine CoA-transferase CaiB-like acyl-CoA transferase